MPTVTIGNASAPTDVSMRAIITGRTCGTQGTQAPEAGTPIGMNGHDMFTLNAQGKWKCNICHRAGVMGDASKQAHLEGKKHLARIAMLPSLQVDGGDQRHLVGPHLHAVDGGTGRPLTTASPAETTTIGALPFGTRPSTRLRLGPKKFQPLDQSLETICTSSRTHIAKGSGITSTAMPPPIKNAQSALRCQQCPIPARKTHVINRENEPTSGSIYRLGSTVVPRRPAPVSCKTTTLGGGRALICVTGQGKIMATDSKRYSTPNTQCLRPRKPGQPKKGVPLPCPSNTPAAVYQREPSWLRRQQRKSNGERPGPAVMNPYHRKLAWSTHTCSIRNLVGQCACEICRGRGKLILRGRNPLVNTRADTHSKVKRRRKNRKAQRG